MNEYSVAEQVAEVAPETEVYISDAEFLKNEMDALLKNDANAAAEKESSDAEREKLIERLVDYFGDDQFKYIAQNGTVHIGTVTQTIDLCPMSESILKGGFDRVVEWITPYKIEKPKVEEEEAEPEPINEPATAPNVPIKEVAKKLEVSVKEVAKEKPKTATKLSEKKEVEVIVAAPSIVIVGPPIAAQVEEVITRMNKTEVVHAVAASKVESSPIEDKGGAVDEVIVTPTLLSREDIVEEPGVVEKLDVHIDLADFLPVVPDDEIETVVEERTDEITVNQEATESVRPPTYFEEWQDLVEKETPLEMLLVTIIDELPISSDDDVELVELSDDLEFTASPELYTLLTEVRLVKTAMDRLNSAKTKEECDKYLNEVVVSLVKLLRSLGYDSPEKLLREFLKTHPLSSLYDLIEALEKSLRVNIQHELYLKNSNGHTRKRHASFGRLVLYVLQTLSGRSAVADMA